MEMFTPPALATRPGVRRIVRSARASMFLPRKSIPTARYFGTHSLAATRAISVSVLASTRPAMSMSEVTVKARGILRFVLTPRRKTALSRNFRQMLLQLRAQRHRRVRRRPPVRRQLPRQQQPRIANFRHRSLEVLTGLRFAMDRSSGSTAFLSRLDWA